jgi:elongation factor P
MSSIQATRLRKGNLIVIEKELYRILELQHVTPGNLRGFVRVKLRNLRNGALADQRLRSDDTIERAQLDEIEMQYMYSDAAGHHFMDTTSYEQITLSDEVLGELIGYLVPESLIKVDFYGANPVGIELPPTVDLAVRDTSPAIKGSTANAQLKPATLETGLVIQVPPFINIGDKVRVSTESGEYQNRA